MQGNVGEEPEERKGSIAAQGLSLVICVLILLGHTNASSAPYGRERLKWFSRSCWGLLIHEEADQRSQANRF